ncbi:WxL domain-containing protein [Fructilactobacillus florum]|uniref:WxL domain-containing protein n=1 Tax=Fructilactobacillus florum TaxID=640331 RepID=UPI00028F09FD|nr:WxL domain-containing protein [Fructilactobacillus florum]EKK20471.1 extracellular protein [Fructilactobacillus florum 2F]
MKKNLFVGGAASLAVVLGLTATVPSVNAATNATLPQNTSTQKDDTKGSVSADSNAHVDVMTGYLTLESVPDLNFGASAQSATNQTQNLLNNNTGNNQNHIKVTDSRATTALNGWTLDASLGNFKDATTGNVAPAGWTMGLNNDHVVNSQNSAVMANRATITSGNTSGANVLYAANGQGAGSTTVDYNPSTSPVGVKSASLEVPGNTAVGSYNAPITWTLTAGAPQDPTPKGSA